MFVIAQSPLVVRDFQRISESFMPDRHTQKPYEIDFRKKRISAFLTTSLALFCLILFLTSASIRQFTTFTDLQITSDLANIQSHIRTAIDEHTSDEKLSSYVTSAANNADLVANPDIATHNLAEIRDSLDMQLFSRPRGQPVRIIDSISGPRHRL